MKNHSMLIKICGIKDPQLAEQAVHLGAHYIGLILYNQSKRAIDMAAAKKIAQAVREAGGEPVAVLVDQTAQEIELICRQLTVRIVQLHGLSARNTLPFLSKELQRIYVIPVNLPGKFAEQDHPIQYLDPKRDFILFDTIQPGSGHSFSWHQFYNPYDFPFFIAGGLNTDNVQTVINQLHPQGVDVSSGVEKKCGVKDLNKIKQFIKQTRSITNE